MVVNVSRREAVKQFIESINTSGDIDSASYCGVVFENEQKELLCNTKTKIALFDTVSKILISNQTNDAIDIKTQEQWKSFGRKVVGDKLDNFVYIASENSSVEFIVG